MTKELLQQYIDGQCTPAEKQVVEQWLLSASQASIDRVLQERWDQAGVKMPDPEKKELWQRLESSISPVRKTGLVRSLPVRWRVAVAAAAVVLLVCLAATWLYTRNLVQEIANNTPQAKQIKLPDGSTVWLNGWSTLSYHHNNFDKNNREVHISGEAYFMVKEDKSKPFIVYAGNIATTVLGTEFNVEAYASEASVKVSLNKGKVAVSFREGDRALSSPVRYLQPGEMLTSSKDRKIAVQAIAVQKAQAWTEGYFVVNDMKLADVLLRMEQRYNIRFHINGGQLPATVCEHVAATFAGENWQQIVQQLCFTCHVESTIEGQDVFLKYSPMQ